DRPLKLALGDMTILKKTIPEGHTTHVHAFQGAGFKALTDNKLGTAPADIHHQTSPNVIGQGVRNAQINQAGLFTAVDHFDGVADHGFGAADKLPGVTGQPQRVGADDLHRVGGHALDALGETLQTLQSPLLGCFSDQVVMVETGGELNLLAQLLHNADFALNYPGNNHMKTVGTNIYCR